MGFILGVVGCAQQLETAAAGGGGPTGVSIATSSSGNYDNAVIVSSGNLGASGEDALAANTGSDFSSNAGSIEFSYSIEYTAMVNNGSGNIIFYVKGYGRSTDGEEWDWDLTTLTSSISDYAGSPVATASFSGTAASGVGAQDQTGSIGVVKRVGVSHVSGGRGYLLMPAGNWVQWKCALDVQGGGTTVTASEVTIKIDVV